MGIEIERRFLVKDKNVVDYLMNEYKDTRKTIIQDYIYSDILTAIRKRKIVKGAKEKYVYTVKTGKKIIAVNEYEEELTKEQYDSIALNPDRYTIEKDRYVVPYRDGLVIELDVFHGKYEGLVFAEIEFKTEAQAHNTEVPDWFAKEIGNVITNNTLSMGIEDVEKYINERIKK